MVALWRAVLLLVVTLWHGGFYLLRRFTTASRPAHLRTAEYRCHAWTRAMLRILDVELVVKGPRPPAGALLCPNHLGYVDIAAMGASVETFLVVRSEMAAWPILGTLVRWSYQPIMRRERSREVVRAGNNVRERLEEGSRMVIFLEGTSTGQDRVLPFNTGFVQPAIDAGAPTVPVGIRWSAADPAVVVGEEICYWKDHEFGPHLLHLAGLGRLRCEVTFGEPISAAGRNRKELAKELREAVCALAGLPAIDEKGWVDPNPGR